MLTIDPIPDRLRFTGGSARSDVTITDANGDTVYERRGVIHPDTWSATAVKVAASKYLKTINGTPETSIFGLVHRVVSTIVDHAVLNDYIEDCDNRHLYEALTSLILSQTMAFNSPVWFNVGIHDRPQASACFINSLGDTMEEILDFVKVEGMLFKAGSGSGVDLSRLRAKNAPLSGGGTASGPVAFMKGLDSMAGVIKSGGGHRRAAAMRILCDWHPDVLDFIRCKEDAEKKAHALIDAGYDGAFNTPGGAYDTVPYQNANHSVAVSAATMARVADGEPGAVALLTAISEAAWACGDPGVWFVDTVNDWNTVPNHGPIRAPNPCGEFNFPDDTACNLASLNLIKFLNTDNTFDVDAFTYAVRVTILAQEILCDLAGYPTPAITKNSHDLRPLGLGYANLGALLMSLGLPYDSDEARHLAAAITSLMSATAYHQSALLAEQRGPFAGFSNNADPMLAVVERHGTESHKLYLSVDEESEAGRIVRLSIDAWNEARKLGRIHGFRNGQVTVLAPTGTIGFMMDCDTTGIEPD
ncbi:MAG: vitamin B12-dependent ribonucleotide reductase, partial [Actinobacteria bacterium]|nr:vitamin B12-dependent ribonucleotide reductase [Actinomycetota bacterium]